MGDTRQRLMDTAERLFARYGIDAVTPRQIVLACRERNQSAIHYHFGSKEGLLATLHGSRMAEINGRRRELLEALPKGDHETCLRALLEAIARPLAERTWTRGGRPYVMFLSHLFADRARRDRAVGMADAATELRQIFRQLRLLVPDLPRALWEERLRLVLGCIIHGLADRERMRAAGRLPRSALTDDRYLTNLIDVGVAMLCAPPTKDSRHTLRRKSHGPTR